jgi:anti-sigma regulatory factor (Ser/Thr protein kinase)
MPRMETAAPSTGRRIVDVTYSAAADLRRLRALATRGLTAAGCATGHVDAVALVLTELATNAVMHAEPPFHAVVLLHDDETIVEVSDRSKRLAVARSPAFVEGGYGLQLINKVARTWGANPSPDGKTVWAAISRRQTL